VIDRDAAVHQHRLLDEALTEHGGEEVEILLRPAGAEGDVMDAS
jgi:hypothetical protein